MRGQSTASRTRGGTSRVLQVLLLDRLRALHFTVDPTSIPGSYTGSISIRCDADSASQTFTLVVEPRVSAVPEPSTLALGGIGGLLALGYGRRRKWAAA
jgi:hypothetical protein